ncbi:hypothetical protein Q5P01_009485 [Channa striata]|uniref:Uncharacterized protein n=1 Tax=Channa striata TaxID=64152 RepID=A0AA88MYX3_CHASR|nr:hypothetical protein Q5P01_009485 [Channa striata]
MDELAALIRLQGVYRESSLLCFTETCLNQDTPDSVVSVNGYTLVQADRSAAESGKKKGGGLAVFVNNRCCNPGHITVKRQLCSKDVELVAVSIRPYYLPQEFSHVLAVTVCIPPSADAAAACECVHSTVSQLQTQHPQALILISEDFNHACLPLSATLPNFTQYVNCHTRDNKTLDLLYANTKNAYTSTPLPPLGRSDHNLVFLSPAYTPGVKKQTPQVKTVKIWTEEAREQLRTAVLKSRTGTFSAVHMGTTLTNLLVYSYLLCNKPDIAILICYIFQCKYVYVFSLPLNFEMPFQLICNAHCPVQILCSLSMAANFPTV